MTHQFAQLTFTPEVRRLQTINVVALLASVFNLVYIVAFLLIDAGDFGLLALTNAISIAAYAGVLYAAHRGRQELSLLLMFTAGPFNLFWVVR